jgi:hypothetical protein
VLKDVAQFVAPQELWRGEHVNIVEVANLGKAIAYTSRLWPGLVRLLGDPKIPLDTNGVERALRGVAVGRTNHYGSLPFGLKIRLMALRICFGG